MGLLTAACSLSLGTHALVLLCVCREFTAAFAVSRGLGAVLLTGLGWYVAIVERSSLAAAYLAHHEPDDWLRRALLVVVGLLISDVAWMLGARLGWGKPVRADLAAHHAIGLVGLGYALWFNVAIATALVTLIAEAMPVTSGLRAAADHFGWTRLSVVGTHARAWVIAFVRLPLWALLAAATIQGLSQGHSDGLDPTRFVALSFFTILVGLDAYWLRKCILQIRRAPGR